MSITSPASASRFFRLPPPVRLAALGLCLGVAMAGCSGGGSSEGDAESSQQATAESVAQGVESSDEAAAPAAGDGGKSVTIMVDGVRYTGSEGTCVAADNLFLFNGTVSSDSGTPAWTILSYEMQSRADAEAEGTAENLIDLLFPDGAESRLSVEVTVNPGAQGIADVVPGQPQWSVRLGEWGEADLTFENGVLTGSGEAKDYSSPTWPESEATAFTVERATCG